MKIIQGNFNKDKSKSLDDKVLEGLTQLKNQSNDEEIRYPFILIVDTGEDLTIAEIAVRQAQALAGAISSSGGSSAPASNAGGNSGNAGV